MMFKILKVALAVFIVSTLVLTAKLRAAAQENKSQPQAVPLDEVVTGEAVDHIRRGNKLFQSHLYDEAIAEYKAALAKSNKPLRTAYLNLGAAYLGKQDYRAAADAYRQALALAPNDFVAMYQLGDSLYALGRYSEAEAEYRKVIESSPGGVNAPARHALGLTLFAEKRIDEAIAEYKTAIEQKRGNYAEAHYNLGDRKSVV